STPTTSASRRLTTPAVCPPGPASSSGRGGAGARSTARTFFRNTSSNTCRAVAEVDGGSRAGRSSALRRFKQVAFPPILERRNVRIASREAVVVSAGFFLDRDMRSCAVAQDGFSAGGRTVRQGRGVGAFAAGAGRQDARHGEGHAQGFR